LEGLKHTKQSGVVAILTTAVAQKGKSVDSTALSYDVDKILGHGSYGTVVYKGKFGNRDVAVKTVHTSVFDGARALNEVKILLDCDSHENIVRYFSTKQDGAIILIALELCDMCLKIWVENKQKEIEPLEILRQVTVGLEWLHSQKIVHRDLKPENVLILEYVKKVKLSDFGLSRRVLDGCSFVATINVGGTPGWVAPEILEYKARGIEAQCKFVSFYQSHIMIPWASQ